MRVGKALMKDQIEALKVLGVPAAMLSSKTSQEEQKAVSASSLSRRRGADSSGRSWTTWSLGIRRTGCFTVRSGSGSDEGGS